MQSNQADIVQQNPQMYSVSGAVDFSTVPALMRRVTEFFSSSGKGETENVRIDLSQVTICNSAGLALILEMAKQAHNNNIEIDFENLPDSLLTIAKAYGVEEEIRDLHK